MLNQTEQTPKPSIPEKFPEKFLDKETGELRVELLLKSYLELEKKLSAPKQEEDNLLEKGLDTQSAEEFAVQINHDMFEADKELNQTFFENGFTEEQVQLVYDVAAEKMMPLVFDLAEQFEMEKEIEKLVSYFGGEEKYREISRQILAWGKKNLKPAVFETMAGNYDGVIALYKMMQDEEPKPIKEKAMEGISNEKEIQSMLKDPRYWREKDPAYIEKVTNAFRDFYSE